MATGNLLEVIIGAKDQFSSTFDKLKNAIVGAISAYAGFQTVRAVAQVFKDVADEADKFSKLSDRLGFTTETLSKIAYAAKLADVEFDSMAQSMQFMLKNTTEAAKGNEGLQETISRLGLNLQELKRMNPDDMFRAYASGLASIQNPAERANIAMEVFGRGGGAMLQMLKDGAEGLDALSKEAEKFGVVVSKQAAYNAAEFNDSLTRMESAFGGVKKALVIDLLPYFTGAFNKFANLIAENRQDIVSWAIAISTAFAKVLEVTLYIVAGITDAWNGLKLIWNGLLYSVADLALGMQNIWTGVVTYIRDSIVSLNESWNKNPILPGTDIFEEAIVGMTRFVGNAKQGQAELLKFQTEILEKMEQISAGGLNIEKVQQFVAEIKAGMEELKALGTAKLSGGAGGGEIRGKIASSVASEIESLKRLWAQYYQTELQQADVWRAQEITKVKGHKEALRLIEEIYQARVLEIRQKAIDAEQDYIKSIETAYMDLYSKQDRNRISEVDKVNIWYQQQLEAHGAFEESRAAIENMYREKKKIAMEEDAAYAVEVEMQKLNIIANALGGFAALSATLGKKMFMVSKALNIGQAIMSTYTGAANALKDIPYPYNFVAAASVIAFGLAQVAQIAKQKPPQAKKGVDFVQADQTFMLHRGERVVPAETNKDLKAFLASGGGGVQIGALSLEFPNIRSAEDLRNMSDREWQDVIETKMIPNMRRLAGAGVKV